jgi:RNA polymerase sigma-70 factor (sigma-E family)
MAAADEQFVEFVQAYSTRLLHAAFLMTGDRHHAEDAVQTALARTYAAWSRVQRDDAYAYTRKVLANHVIDAWRRPIREHATDHVPERPVRGDVAHEVIQREWLLRALDSLGARERTIVVMRHFFDLSEAEVARELRVTVGTVKRANSRALAKLRITVQPGQTSMVAGEGTA